MLVEQIDPEKDPADFAEWFALWRLTSLEKFPDDIGWDERDILSMVAAQAAAQTQLLSCHDDAGTCVGAALVHVPLRDNRHAVGIDIRVHPDHRRRGVGRVILGAIEQRARADHRTTINCITYVPVGQEGSDPSVPFALALGFASTQPGHRRHLTLPIDAALHLKLRHEVDSARDASDYRMLTLRGPWPEEFVDDQCALERAMSTDQPQGDSQAEEEVWDAARIVESTASMEAQGVVSLVAASQHIDSGRLVAYSRIVVAERRPTEAWQWATIVLPEHRGHRLGLAVKLANLEFLSSVMPTARRVITSNAAVNAPMIAVNDLLGFEIDAVGAFWQKTLD